MGADQRCVPCSNGDYFSFLLVLFLIVGTLALSELGMTRRAKTACENPGNPSKSCEERNIAMEVAKISF